MSRHVLEINGKVLVVGYDPPLQTYFGQVWVDIDNDEEPEDWFGLLPKELTKVEQVEERLGFSLPSDLRIKLDEDRLTAPAPSPLQKMMINAIDKMFPQAGSEPEYRETMDN